MEDLKKYLRDNVGKSVRPEEEKKPLVKKTAKKTTKKTTTKRTTKK
jgi:hypothetical protein